ncbi:MAG: pilus assembly protein TadG-related protein, partial [Anaerolineales bacterium]|nr:pilus assembly protein TadG-related protein [Anaerolineales bacterium]
MNNKLGQRGQALILIVLGIVGLVAITGLAIDAGHSFSDRRNAQNAADTASLAAALAKINNQNVTSAVFSRAASNGYTSDGIHDTVTVNNPPTAGCNGSNGPYAGNSEYIQVIIHSNVDTFFAPIVGVDQLHNCVDAIARAKPAHTGEMFFGNAVVGLSPHGCDTVWAHGNQTTTTTGGGIWDNSDAASCAFRQNGSGYVVAPSVSVVGGASYSAGHVTPPPVTGAQQFPYPPEYIFPTPTCSGAGSAIKSGQNATLSPGSYSSFPPSGLGGVKNFTLQSGIYCVGSEWRVNGNETWTGQNVLIYMVSGGITWNGNATINLDAPDSGDYKGLLIYLPLTNSSTVTINGNSGSHFTGTFLAPAAPISVLGTGSANGFHSQVIGYTVELGG